MTTLPSPSPLSTVPDLPCWPPKTHIVRRKDLPVKEGTIALCGAKLMGIHLDGDAERAQCQECLTILRKELGT